MTYSYDGAGRRQERTIGATATGYLHDGINPVQEQQGATTNNVFAGGTDTFFSRVDANGNRTYLRDRLGSTLGLVDSAGTVQTSYTYEPFGKASSAGQASTNPYQFTGRENDGLGLMYYRARYYSPVLHRFVSEDPIGFGGGINSFVYVKNDPISYGDPSGYDRTSPWTPPQWPGSGPIFPPRIVPGPGPIFPPRVGPGPIFPPRVGPGPKLPGPRPPAPRPPRWPFPLPGPGIGDPAKKPDILEFERAIKECEDIIGRKLSRDERRRLHDWIQQLKGADGKVSKEEIVEECVALFG